MTHRLARYLGRRLAQAVGIVAGIAVINFLLLHLAPGDVVDVLAGEAGTADAAYVTELQKFGRREVISAVERHKCSACSLLSRFRLDRR